MKVKIYYRCNNEMKQKDLFLKVGEKLKLDKNKIQQKNKLNKLKYSF